MTERMDKRFRDLLSRKSDPSIPRSRDPWKYADVPDRDRVELNGLHDFLSQLEQEHLGKLDQFKNAQTAQISLSEDPDPEILKLRETQFANEFEQFSTPLQNAYQKERAVAIDAYFNVHRPSQEEESTRPIAVFVENSTLVLQLSIHFVFRSKKLLARAERYRQLRKASNVKGWMTKLQRTQAAKKLQSELQEMEGFSPLYTNASGLIAQAIKNLSNLCEAGDGTARIGGIALPVQVELVGVTHGAKPQKGKLNIQLYSQIPEVRSKLSLNYNVSHAYLWSAAVPSLGNLLARFGFCALYINLMLGTSGEPTTALYRIAIHELLHTLGIQDQYKSRSQKVHPDIADNDIMYTVGEHARILDYVFNKILTVTKKLNALS